MSREPDMKERDQESRTSESKNSRESGEILNKFNKSEHTTDEEMPRLQKAKYRTVE